MHTVFAQQAETHFVDGGDLGNFMCKATTTPTAAPANNGGGGGAASSKACAFPFKWGGSSFSECTSLEDPFGPWCATTVDEDCEMTAWGHCDCTDAVPPELPATDAGGTGHDGLGKCDGDGLMYVTLPHVYTHRGFTCFLL